MISTILLFGGVLIVGIGIGVIIGRNFPNPAAQENIKAKEIPEYREQLRRM